MRQDMAVLTSHKSVDWYTPAKYIQMVRHVFDGTIDLDPASAAMPQQWIKAEEYYTIEDDGLGLPWYGQVFLNPPYGKNISGKSNAEIWLTKLYAELDEGNVHAAIVLVNSSHGYNWYEYLWYNHYTCQVRERIHFIDQDGFVKGPAKRAQTFALVLSDPFGYNSLINAFTETFSTIGRIIGPWSKATL